MRGDRRAPEGQKLLGLAALALTLALPGLAPAAWFGYRNDTRAVIVVQTSVTVNGRLVRGKAHVLYPGEMAWDNIAAPGVRTVSVFDPKANNRLVLQENVFIQNQDIFLSAQLRPVAQLPGRPPQPPQLRLIPGRAPGPPGVVPPKPTSPTPTPGTTPIPPRGPLPPTAQPKAPPPPAEAPKAKSG